MAKKRVDAILNFPGDPRVLASVSTTPSMIVLTKGAEAKRSHLLQTRELSICKLV